MAGAALAGTLATPRAGYCAEDYIIKIALVGCGGRGGGAAANALGTTGPTRLWAMADVFPQKVEGTLQSLSAKFTSQVPSLELPRGRVFIATERRRRDHRFDGH